MKKIVVLGLALAGLAGCSGSNAGFTPPGGPSGDIQVFPQGTASAPSSTGCGTPFLINATEAGYKSTSPFSIAMASNSVFGAPEQVSPGEWQVTTLAGCTGPAVTVKFTIGDKFGNTATTYLTNAPTP